MESIILEAKKEFQEILNYVLGDAQNQQIHEVERNIFVRLIQLGLTLLKLFLAAKGDGNVGETHADQQGVTRLLHSTKAGAFYGAFLLRRRRAPDSASMGFPRK